MFCPNCGSPILKLNQRFCHICGINLSMVFNRPQLRTERSQDGAIAKSQLTPAYPGFPSNQQIQVKTNKVDSNSKKCFVFALISLIIAIFSVFSGGAILFIIFLFTMTSRNTFGLRLIGFIVTLLINSVGLTLGIFSRVYNTKAGKSNLSNSIKKVGSVFGIIGIIFNTILLIVALIIMGIVIAFGTF
ncbi:MAG: zinc ribbon domain-containing protein [Promethearchaeota archaeon]|nr:MAG: zinc ribbon domain-containing protein [Candidatus Lokiarchaeota archaeon]